MISFLDIPLTSAAENLALDDVLLAEGDAGGEVLRLWELERPVVIVGRASRVAEEVDVAACERIGAAIVRRASGGAAIVAGPGCLCYSLVLRYELRPHLRPIDAAHRYVLSTLAEALGPLVPGVACRGTSDLCLGEKKFSGNSLRCKQHALLYHGTLLYDFPLDLIGQLLRPPPRQPAYRAQRPHGDFVANLPLPADVLRDTLRLAFHATTPCTTWPAELAPTLARTQYHDPAWNRQR